MLFDPGLPLLGIYEIKIKAPIDEDLTQRCVFFSSIHYVKNLETKGMDIEITHSIEYSANIKIMNQNNTR